MVKRILISGGGTGGHVYPALAIVEALKEKGKFEFLYIGGKDGIETRIVPQQGIPMETIWIAGLSRRFTLKNLMLPFKLMSSLYRSRQIIKTFNPHAAVGTGGYVSGPALYAASRLGVPLLIQEQDVYPGLTTRLLGKYAARICLSFPAAQKYFRKHDKKIVVTGNPVRQGLIGVDRETAAQNLELDPGALTVLIFGGSQGARSINTAMTKIIPDLLKTYSFQVLWQTGESQYDRVKEINFDHGKRVRIVPYIQKMNEAYAVADVIICRAGASSLAELALAAKAAILVPYPYASGDHQKLNSRMMVDQGAALMVVEGEGWIEELKLALEKMLTNKKLREKQSAAWKKIARPQAAAHIADEVIKLLDR